MSEELGVRSEELIPLLRKCSSSDAIENCKECKLLKDCECVNTLMRLAADELERLTRERAALAKIASKGEEICDRCKHGAMKGKPCYYDTDLRDCFSCTDCICGLCNDGDKFELD